MATGAASQPAHEHGHVHGDEAGGRELAAQTELEGELLLGLVTEAVGRAKDARAREASPVRRVLDIGCGPGVASCELARLFPEAHIVAIDSSAAMLDRARQRAAAQGLDTRISMQLAEVPGGLDRSERVDLIWASMSLHHIGDEVTALRALRSLLKPSGVIVVAEIAEPMHLLPDELDVGQFGLADRIDRAGSKWFAAMRDGLTGTVPSTELASMVTTADLEVVVSYLARQRLDPPLPDDARRVVRGHLRRVHDHLGDYLDDDDLRALEVLTDADDSRGVMRRSDVFVDASRQIVIARPMTHRRVS